MIAFGPEVARRLAAEDLPGWVRVADYGISGMHLAYDLAEGYETAILIDAAPRGDEPGTVTVLSVAAEHRRDLAAAVGPLGASRLFDSHGMQPDVVLGVLDMLGGGGPARILVVGCEPATVDYAMELSGPVASACAVDEAVQVILGLVAEGRARPPGRRGPRGGGPRGPPARKSPGRKSLGPPGQMTPKSLRPLVKECPMCLGIPGEVIEFLPEQPDLARVDVSGVRRVINVGLLSDEPPEPGEWVLIHVGFALSKIDEAEAAAALEFLEGIGQAYEDELAALRDSKIE